MAGDRYRLTISIILYTLAFSGLLSCHGPFETDDSSSTIIISGTVVDQTSGEALDSTVVAITEPSKFQQSTTTDSDGAFSFEIESDEDVSLTLTASRTDYEIFTRSVDAGVGQNVANVSISLSSTTNDNSGNDGNNNDNTDEVTGAAAIVLASQPKDFININETGDEVSAPLTFQVEDSLGRPLTAENAVEVQFKLVSSPGGGETLIPKTATTDEDGQVTTTLFSGNKAGEIKLQALVERPEVGLSVKSSPVLIAIHGGFPDANHFSLAPAKRNFEGFNINNNRNTISVVLGDKFSNPVKPGTVVYFSTTGGTIQGSGNTDDDGIVEVEMISGDPRPSDGHATVTASTVNEDSTRIQKNVEIVMSTTEANISASPTSFNLCSDSNASFQYTVTDLNGNPMAAGTKISISAGEGIELTGDTSFTLGDYTNPGPGRTEFNFSIRDTDEESNESADLTIQITVTAPSGNATTFSGIQGTRCKAAVH